MRTPSVGQQPGFPCTSRTPLSSRKTYTKEQQHLAGLHRAAVADLLHQLRGDHARPTRIADSCSLLDGPDTRSASGG